MSTSPTLTIPSQVSTSLAAPAKIKTAIDPQSKVLQIAAVIARIALSAIATVAAFVFLPLPFAIVATAGVVLANIGICFCRCTSQHQRFEGSLQRETYPIHTPGQSKSPANIPSVTETAPDDQTIIRPEPLRPNTGLVLPSPAWQSQDSLDITASLDTSAPAPQHPDIARIDIAVELEAPQVPNGPGLGGTIEPLPEQPAALASSGEQRPSEEQASVTRIDPPDFAVPPQPPTRMDTLRSEMPYITYPASLDHLPMQPGALAAPAAPALLAPELPSSPSTLPVAARLTSLPGQAGPSGDLASPSPQAKAIAPPHHLGVSDREEARVHPSSDRVIRTHSVGSAGYQTLTSGHRGRFAHSLTAAAAAPGSRLETAPQRRIRLQPKDFAASRLVEDASVSGSDTDSDTAALPGTVAGGFGEKDVSI